MYEQCVFISEAACILISVDATYPKVSSWQDLRIYMYGMDIHTFDSYVSEADPGFERGGF